MWLEAFRKQVTPLLTELEASANAHDTDRHLAVYFKHSSLTFVANGEIIRGWDALRERQLQWWKGGRATGIYEYVGDPIFEVLAEDLGMTTLLISARANVEGNGLHERQLAYSALWRKGQDRWRIVYAHESSNK